jgi:hypothetical protein
VKKFKEGDAVEVQRAVSYAPWEPATYVRKLSDWRGWHKVKLPKGKERRVDLMTGEECADDNPRGRLIRNLSVPSRRIRATVAPVAPASCFRCDGTGKLCNLCGEAPQACRCEKNGEEDHEWYDCDDCGGTGK